MKLVNRGVTLIELIVVMGILAILSTIAVGVYTKELRRARIAKTRAEIFNLEVAISRYQIDTGQFPPSSTGTILAPGNIDPVNPAAGNGYMQLALRGSLNGNAASPLSPNWFGPYFEFQENRLGNLDGSPVDSSTSSPASVNFLDAWGNPFIFISSAEYSTLGGTFLPASSPYAATEVYFNASTFQLISLGPDGVTNTGGNALGTDPDDIVNWEASGF